MAPGGGVAVGGRLDNEVVGRRQEAGEAQRAEKRAVQTRVRKRKSERVGVSL